MGELLGALTVLALIVVGSVLAAKVPSQGTAPKKSSEKSIKCPTCGSPATVRGSSWECGWCGDFGNLSRK